MRRGLSVHTFYFFLTFYIHVQYVSMLASCLVHMELDSRLLPRARPHGGLLTARSTKQIKL